ncbi:right-handed parallel beta-helix repeat-containing protein [Planctomycetota bacterium]
MLSGKTPGGGYVDKVVFLQDANEATILDGFTITGGVHGVYCLRGSPTIRHNRIEQNDYGIYYLNTYRPLIMNNWIYRNDTGIYTKNSYNTAFVFNNTITYNHDTGVEKNGGYFDPNIVNCIVWGNENYQLVSCSATYSCTDYDPDFVLPDANDFHLKSDSDCIDAGNPNGYYYGLTDIDGHLRIMDGDSDPNTLIIDIGADEAPCGDCDQMANYADFNHDGLVNLFDYAELADAWMNVPPGLDPEYDLYPNNIVNIADLYGFSDEWLWKACWYDTAQMMGMSGGGGEKGRGQEKSSGPSYSYIITVGKSLSASSEYDFNTINDAIVAMSSHTLDADHRGCIHIYPGTYIEQLNDFYPNSNNLPAYCDLIGMGAAPKDVIIQHQRRGPTDPDFAGIGPEIYAYGIKAQGDNLISNLSIHNVGFNQNSLVFNWGGTLDNCLIDSQHDAVTAFGHLTLSGGTIQGKFRPCVQAFGSFEISNCTIIPDTRDWGGEHPAGIKVTKSGTIDNVTIRADIASSDYEPHYDTPWLAGVITQLLNPDDTVTITNSTMDLTLTTLYHDDRPAETAAWELFGVVSGGRNPTPTTKFPGTTVIDNCRITLNGVEDTSNPNGDGRGIMVAGLCLQGGGEIEILGKTTISTSRTTAGFAKDGYEYSLNNQNGILSVESDTVKYDTTKTNGTITKR